MVPCAGPVFEELQAFIRVCVHFFRKEAPLQLPEVMMKSNCLVGGRLFPLLRECLEDMAILRRLTARYQLQVCNPKAMDSTIQAT